MSSTSTQSSTSGATPQSLDGGPTVAQLRSMLATAISLLDTVAASLGRVAASESVELLTAAEFAQRLGGGVKPGTIEDWCRAGEFPAAQPWGRPGWRIPAFYLTRRTVPAHLTHLFDVPGTDAQGTGDSSSAAGQGASDASATEADGDESPVGKGEPAGAEGSTDTPAPASKPRKIAEGTDHEFDMSQLDTATESRVSTRPAKSENDPAKPTKGAPSGRQRIALLRDRPAAKSGA